MKKAGPAKGKFCVCRYQFFGMVPKFQKNFRSEEKISIDTYKKELLPDRFFS